jgi:hypothetical protein
MVITRGEYDACCGRMLWTLGYITCFRNSGKSKKEQKKNGYILAS